MINDYTIELITNKFKHHDKLIVIYMYKHYVFGIVSELIPDLRLPQVTRDEFERCLRTDGGEANLETLLGARCIFTPDKAREIVVLGELMDKSYHESVITHDEIRKLIREEIESVYKPGEEPVIPPPIVKEPEAVKPKKSMPKPSGALGVLDQVSLNLQGDD